MLHPCSPHALRTLHLHRHPSNQPRLPPDSYQSLGYPFGPPWAWSSSPTLEASLPSYFAPIPFALFPFALFPFALFPFALIPFVSFPFALIPFVSFPFALIPFVSVPYAPTCPSDWLKASMPSNLWAS